MKKVLILTGSYWSGHNRAAKVLEKQIISEWNQAIVLDIVDFFNDNSLNSGNFTKSFYEDFCDKYKKVWEMTFNIFDDNLVKRFIYGIKYPFLQSKFDDFVNVFQPDSVISVFPFWQWFIKHYIKNYWKNFTTWVFITDSIKIHSIWYLNKDYIDYYFVIDNFTKTEFIKKFEHNKDNVIVSFFPLEKEFYQNRKKIEIKNILFLLTSQTEEFALDLLEILKNREDLNILIAWWRNKNLLSYVSIFYEDVKNFSFYEFYNIKENIKNIDLIISKPGWAIISECVANDIPVIVPSFIAGQEEWNKLLVEKAEIGFFETNREKINFSLKYINFDKFLPNFAKMKNINSTDIILDKLLK